ncbi:unnamed protein product, partial [marine sediment metagenome]
GWQGIELNVPEEWNIGGIGGGREDGYLRVQDAELPRVEVKWGAAEGFVNIDATVNGYLKKLRQDKKAGKAIEIDTDASVVSKRKMKKKVLSCFTWRTDVCGYGAAWYCAECKRTVIVQVTARPEEDGAKLAERIIASIQDHPVGGWIRWATYGFQTHAPEGFALTAQKLMAGHIQITLKRDITTEGARSIMLQNLVAPEELTLSRWGMANVILKNKTLEQWAEEEMGGRLKRIKPQMEPAQVNGHEALHVSAQHLPLHQQFFRLIARFADVPY